MIISEKQLTMMFQVLTDSLCLVGRGYPFKLDAEARRELANEIMNQQSEQLHEVKE